MSGDLGGNSKILGMFTPESLGKILTHFDEHIVQMGWFNRTRLTVLILGGIKDYNSLLVILRDFLKIRMHCYWLVILLTPAKGKDVVFQASFFVQGRAV